MPQIVLSGKNVGEVSDGYHTFNELYRHRILLFCLAAYRIDSAWKSQQHSDGEMFPGWFIAGMDVGGMSITYHLPIAMWGLCPGEILAHAPAWDGHTPDDVCERIELFLLEHASADV